MKSFPLEFHPQSHRPMEEGDYLLYNQCDGFHLVGWCAELGFHAFGGGLVQDDCYQLWAKLPEKIKLWETLWNTDLNEAISQAWESSE